MLAGSKRVFLALRIMEKQEYKRKGEITPVFTTLLSLSLPSSPQITFLSQSEKSE